MRNKVLSTVILIVVILMVGALIVFNMSRPEDHTDNVWDEGTTMGKMDAKNYYVMYTDLACPYCDAFSRAVAEHEEEFRRDFIEAKDILFEVRVTEFLKLYGEHKPNMSEWSAEAIYCAREEGKFWEYYHKAVLSLWEDYQSKGYNAAANPNMTANYWLEIGHKLGLSSAFDSCYTEHKMLDKVRENTMKASQYIDGLPYFKFGSFTTGGFDTVWGWDYVKQYMNAGLKK